MNRLLASALGRRQVGVALLVQMVLLLIAVLHGLNLLNGSSEALYRALPLASMALVLMLSVQHLHVRDQLARASTATYLALSPTPPRTFRLALFQVLLGRQAGVLVALGLAVALVCLVQGRPMHPIGLLLFIAPLAAQSLVLCALTASLFERSRAVFVVLHLLLIVGLSVGRNGQGWLYPSFEVQLSDHTLLWGAVLQMLLLLTFITGLAAVLAQGLSRTSPLFPSSSRWNPRPLAVLLGCAGLLGLSQEPLQRSIRAEVSQHIGRALAGGSPRTSASAPLLPLTGASTPVLEDAAKFIRVLPSQGTYAVVEVPFVRVPLVRQRQGQVFILVPEVREAGQQHVARNLISFMALEKYRNTPHNTAQRIALELACVRAVYGSPRFVQERRLWQALAHGRPDVQALLDAGVRTHEEFDSLSIDAALAVLADSRRTPACTSTPIRSS